MDRAQAFSPGEFRGFMITACAVFTHFYMKVAHLFLKVFKVFTVNSGIYVAILLALVIMMPLILPVAMEYGIDPIHPRIIFLANMQIGYFTPPAGMNLFVASYRFRLPVADIYRSTLLFMMVLLLALVVITYWPGLSLMFLR